MKSKTIDRRSDLFMRQVMCVAAVVLVSLLAHFTAQAESAPKSPAQIRDELLDAAHQRPLASSEMFKLAIAYLREGNLLESLTVSQLGMGTTSNPEEKAAFYAAIAEANGGLGRFEAAAQAALEGSRLNPQSKELVALRFGYFSKLNDPAQMEAARDHLRRLEPGGKDVFFTPADIFIVVTTAKPIIEALAGVYEVYYELHLKEKYGRDLRNTPAGEKLRKELEAKRRKLEAIAAALERIYPVALNSLPRQ